MNFEDFAKELNINISNACNNKTDETKNEPTTVISITNNVKPIKKLKLLIVSTHINQVNGYSKVTYNLIKELAKNDWIELVHFGTQTLKNADIQRKYPSGVKVIDGSALDKSVLDKTKDVGSGFGFAELPTVIRSEKPDIVFIYNDLAIISLYIEEIRKAFTSRSFKIWAYVDMMYNYPPKGLIDNINRDVDRVFSFTKEWKLELKNSGVTRPIDVMKHGFDNKMFRTIPKSLARQSLGLPSDVFMFMSLNRNQPRKRLDLLIISFVKLITKYPAKPIYMLIINDNNTIGHQLFDIYSNELRRHSASLDIFGNRLMISSNSAAYKDEDINVFYNMADVGVSCAEGEGFGLCTFESMGVGVPQIVPKIKGYSDYCTSDNSLMIEPKSYYYLPKSYNLITGEAQVVDATDVANAMEQYVFDEELRKLHGKRGKETVSEYTWEKVMTTFIKRLRHEYEEDEEDD